VDTALPTEEIDVDPEVASIAQPSEIDNEDGTTTLLVDGNEPPTDTEWFSNLADTFSPDELDELAEKYLVLIEQDMEARADRDKMQAEGLKKAGLGGPAPGGADFEGASRVTHPVLMEAYIDFASSAIKELFPPNGPVRTKIEGKPSKDKMERAKRKAAFLNWQLTTQIPAYRPELEILLSQLPVGGSQYMKIYQDESRKRPNVEFVSIDEIVLPYHAHNFYDLPRKFHRMQVSDFEYQRRISSGLYLDLSLPTSYQATEDETETQRQKAKVEGKQNDYSSDTGERVIYEGCVYEELDDPKAPEGKMCPYLITIDDQSRKVLALYRNWDEDSKTQQELDYLVDFTFIPFDGVFGLSLLQCLSGLPDALTGSLRALLDSALISNLQGGLKLRGTPGGASLSVSPTQVTEVDAMGQDDIRKIYMPIPFNQPSPVLYELLGFLTSAAQGVVGTAEEKIADASNNMPVGTTLALIEQGAKVFSAIHSRLHNSQMRCLEILHRLNRNHLPEKFQYGTDPEDYILRADFEGAMDVHPVSDPNIFSEAQRFAQVQFVIQSITQIAAVNTQVITLFDWRKLFAQAFEMAKIPGYEEFLPIPPEAQPLNPADENVNMVMGKPVKAFEGQNHEAHIQVLLDFAQNPLFGKSPVIAQHFIPAALNHLQDHLLVWYGEMMKRAAAEQIGASAQVDWDNNPDSSIALAQAAPVVDKAAEAAFAKIPAIVAQAMQALQAMAPKPPVDPMVQVAQADVQGKQEIAKGQLALSQQKSQGDTAVKLETLKAKAQDAQQKYDTELKKAGLNAETELKKAALQAQTDLILGAHDNKSDEAIAAMHAASAQASKSEAP